MRRGALLVPLVACAVGMPLRGDAQAQAPTHVIRREPPTPDAVRQARAAGMRDESGRPGPRYWQLWTEYTIRARLDPGTSTVSGTETIRVRNDADRPLMAIQLRLDQNVFRPDAPRNARIGETTDGMVLHRVAVDGRPIGLPAERATASAAKPPALSGTAGTSERITLAQPVEPGSTTVLEIDWRFRVPLDTVGAAIRMGRLGDSVYQVAQWYPRVAMFDDLQGWDTARYLGEEEFYNNYGRFDVSLDLPAGWLVGATGVLQNPERVLSLEARERLGRVRESDARITIVGAEERLPRRSTATSHRVVWRFVADTASDFAWAASDRYVWDATRATIPGRGAIPIHLFYLPKRAEHFAGADTLARQALEFYSWALMPYAFPQLTLVDGPEHGMEYPMLVMSTAAGADHEIAHQWWPMMVGTNETRYPFMDEGFASYMTRLLTAYRAGAPPVLDGRGRRYGLTIWDDRGIPLLSADDHRAPPASLQHYAKPPQMFAMLGGIVGDSAVWRALSGYAKAWRFRHPSPWDFMSFMDSALQQHLGWFWHSWLFTTDAVDGSIQRVTSAGTRLTVTVRQHGGMPSPVVLAVECRRSGRPIAPIPSGRRVDPFTAIVTYGVDVWFPGTRTFTARFDPGCDVDRVTLDPFHRFPDHDACDNVWPRRRSGCAPPAPNADSGRRRAREASPAPT
jgi:hypothetical protein